MSKADHHSVGAVRGYARQPTLGPDEDNNDSEDVDRDPDPLDEEDTDHDKRDAQQDDDSPGRDAPDPHPTAELHYRHSRSYGGSVDPDGPERDPFGDDTDPRNDLSRGGSDRTVSDGGTISTSYAERYGHPDASTDRLGPAHDTDVDPYDHHRGRSSAATYFDPSDVDDPRRKHQFERLKSWNDGVYDDDRQSWEGERDKQEWAETYGTRLSLPSSVIKVAQEILSDLDDLRQLGVYNGLHTAVLASLTLGYQRHWFHRDYRLADNDDATRWCDRDDFRRLWQSLDLTEDDLRRVVKLVNKKTDV